MRPIVSILVATAELLYAAVDIDLGATAVSLNSCNAHDIEPADHLPHQTAHGCPRAAAFCPWQMWASSSGSASR